VAIIPQQIYDESGAPLEDLALMATSFQKTIKALIF